MNNDIRNAYGFPLMVKLEEAREYAAAARVRNKPPCQCATCQHIERLPSVIQITQRWKK